MLLSIKQMHLGLWNHRAVLSEEIVSQMLQSILMSF